MAKAKRTATAKIRKTDIVESTRALIKQMQQHASMYSRATQDLSPQQIDNIIREVLEKATSKRAALDHSDLSRIINELIAAEGSQITQERIAYLGPKYSYSYLAATSHFGESSDLVPVASISAVFEEVHSERCNFGIVPIENSTDGRIVDTLNILARQPTRICGDVQLRIHHHLLANCKRDQVKTVFSKPQAISQCRDWLSKHLPFAEIVDTTSTTAAAKIAASEDGAAAIASIQAGRHFGLNVLASEIEDFSENVTRFAVIGNVVTKPTRTSRTSMMFELPHEPGALADAMAIFKKSKLNLTWIESFPKPDTPKEYVFFVEVQGHQDHKPVNAALNALKRHTDRLECLGSYPVGEVIDGK